MKYPECASCAFYGVEPSICEECEDADQWEPDEDVDDQARLGANRRKIVRLMRRNEQLKEAA